MAAFARNRAWQQLRTATQGVEDQLVLARHTVDVLNALVVRQLEGKTNTAGGRGRWRSSAMPSPGVARGTVRGVTATGATEVPAPAEPVMAKAA